MKKMFSSFVFCCLFFRQLVVCVDTDEVKTVSVTEGNSVTLESGVTELQTHDLISWTVGHPGTRIALIDKDAGKFSTSDDALDGRFRGRLKLDHQTGSLIITNTRTTDSGDYKVIISRSSKPITHRFNVTVYASPNSTGSPDSPNKLLIPLIAAAAAGFLLLIAALGIFWIYRKNRKTDQQDQTRNEDVTYADPTFFKKKADKSGVKVEEDVVYADVRR